jgi:hypothetical protein
MRFHYLALLLCLLSSSIVKSSAQNVPSAKTGTVLIVQSPAQNVRSAKAGTVLKNPTSAQIKAPPGIVTARNAFGTIQAAISSTPIGPVDIFLSCGIYVENIVITTSDVKIHGQERGCVKLQPADPALPVITIDSTNTGGINFDEVSDLTISCPFASCADGLKITGRTDIGQMNDFHKFSRLGVYGPFLNGIDLAGRTIWTVFENMEVAFARRNGINIASAGTTNELTFRNVRSARNNGYGFYVNNTQLDLANGILFDTVNAEYNGQNTGLRNCAGIYLTGVAQANIQNSYFEGNCEGNTADNTAAEVRLTGTYAQSVNITNSNFNLQYGEGGIYNDAVLTTGNYSGNKFDTSSGNFTIYIATYHAESDIVVGPNFHSNPIVVPDGNGVTHVRMLSPFSLDYQPITSVNGNSVDVSGLNIMGLYYGPYTINSLIGGHVGQLLYITAVNENGHVLANRAGGNGQIAFPDGQNRTLNAGETLSLIFDGTYWRSIESATAAATAGPPRYVATITTTGALADQIYVQGITGSSHCLFSARNAAAAVLTGLYLTTDTGAITLNHPPYTGGVFDVFCSSN